MLKKGYNPRTINRTKFLEKSTELNISAHTEAEITECMLDKTDEEKEKLAVRLIEIITTSSSEKEMIERAEKLR